MPFLLTWCNWLPLPTLVTNRDQSEGGHFDGSLNKRLEWLKQADLAHAAYIDVEFAFWEAFNYQPKHAQVILSHHDFHGMGGDLSRIVSDMYQLERTSPRSPSPRLPLLIST